MRSIVLGPDAVGKGARPSPRAAASAPGACTRDGVGAAAYRRLARAPPARAAPPARGETDHGSTLNPYLNFNGNAREAMTFYQQVLGGELTSAPSTSSAVGGLEGVMHAQLETPDGFTLMASDTAPGMGEVTPGALLGQPQR